MRFALQDSFRCEVSPDVVHGLSPTSAELALRMVGVEELSRSLLAVEVNLSAAYDAQNRLIEVRISW